MFMDGLPRDMWHIILAVVISVAITTTMFLIFGVAVPALTH